MFLVVVVVALAIFAFAFVFAPLVVIYVCCFFCQSRLARWQTQPATIVKYMTRVVYIIFCEATFSAQIVCDSSCHSSRGNNPRTHTRIYTLPCRVANFLEGIFVGRWARLAELYVQLNLPLPHLWLLRQRQPWPFLTWIYEITQIHIYGLYIWAGGASICVTYSYKCCII